MTDVNALIRGVLEQQGRLPESPAKLRDDDDLYASGLSSHASVNVMLALEDTFDVEFPDSMLRKSTFQSIGSIRDALASLGVVVDPG
jgi:acyl carrier protein